MTHRLKLFWQIVIAGLSARLSRRPQRLAILAGAGELPRIAAETAFSRKIDFVVYHIVEADLNRELAADTRFERRSVSLGNISQTIQYLRQDRITQVILLGKVEKQRLLQDVTRDAAAEEIYTRAADRRDDTLFRQFAALLRAIGIRILKQKELLPGCFLPRGIHTKKKPETKALLEDIEFGYELSRKVGSLDIGQTAVVFEKMILAVEAIEGTDAAIRRAGEIALRKGGVVCKTAKTSQDPRFDLPAVGLRTLETMAESGMQALVI
ncbi:MAG TPA: UDP-2,3-diacylglucosamine diphosphatase LpxI, partial [Turneriella sp.]|nr:UDP-2,3-diacylglucosamine diphosphatase LpxI [Turneriella sp.]